MGQNSRRTIAIIPVRGGSVGIPRKNARLLGGKPLLTYSIRNCLDSREIEAVYVSTDDAELAEIAVRNGVKVLRRPAALADATATLDDVVLEAVDQLEQEGENIGYVVTVQATSPLLKPATIDSAIRQCRHVRMETVVSVFNDPHLSWEKNEHGAIIPAYEKRLNRQHLPPRYRETGGVVVCPLETLKLHGSRFGESIGIVEVDRVEAIDIDDYFDWWLAEKSLQRKNICFHVIGNRHCGLGHVYRALTLADRLVDHDLWFIVNEDSTLAAEIIAGRYYEVKVVPRGREVENILSNHPDLVVNDVLDTTEPYMRTLRESGLVSINFEDLGPGASYADYVINSMYVDKEIDGAGPVFNGAQYCCLRDEFYSIEPVRVRRTVGNILLLFGGSDPSGLTLKILKWLDEISGDWRITVVLGVGYLHPEKVSAFREKSKHEIEVVHKTSIISRYMREADVAVTSAGRTVYELGSLGVPVISIAANEREMRHSFVKGSPGVIFLGMASELEKEKFGDVVRQVVGSDILRRKMSQNLQGSEIRSGIDNVLEIISRALAKSDSHGG